MRTIAPVALLLLLAGCLPDVEYRNVNPPRYIGCGGFHWRVRFVLDDPAPEDGWVIQEIRFRPNILECNGNPRWTTPMTYWEAFGPVRRGQTDAGTDLWQSFAHANARSGWATAGEARFYPSARLPADFRRNHPNTAAGTRPSSTRQPPRWNDAGDPLNRSLDVRFDCCEEGVRPSVTITPTEQVQYVRVP